jgi:hypothetical protein
MVRVMANSAIIIRVVIKWMVCKLISQVYYYYYYYYLVRVHILLGAYYRISASSEIYHPHTTKLSKTSEKSQVLKQVYIDQNLQESNNFIFIEN